MATISSYFLLDNKSFYTKTVGDSSKVIRTGVGKVITQTEKDVAGKYYDAEKDEIEYAQIQDLGFGPNYITQGGSSDTWMAQALSNPTFKKIFKKATGKSSPNINNSTIRGENQGWAVTEQNQDANGRSTLSGRPRSRATLRYPLNENPRIKYDYMQVSAYEHEPNTFGNEGGFREADERMGKKVGTVFLPMQQGLADSSGVDWNQGEANPFEATLFGTAQGAIKKFGAAKDLKGMKDAASATMAQGIDAAGNLLGGVEGNDIASYFAGQAIGNQGLFTRGTGKILNPNLELLFQGPSLRKFNYNFQFTPREKREANLVRKIIRFFKKNMAVQTDDSKLFLMTPNVFKLKYIFKSGQDHPFLNKIKMCALTNCAVQYNPDGSYMTYEDGSMTSYGLQLAFSELNPIYSRDWEKGGTNDMGF